MHLGKNNFAKMTIIWWFFLCSEWDHVQTIYTTLSCWLQLLLVRVVTGSVCSWSKQWHAGLLNQCKTVGVSFWHKLFCFVFCFEDVTYPHDKRSRLLWAYYNHLACILLGSVWFIDELGAAIKDQMNNCFHISRDWHYFEMAHRYWRWASSIFHR